MSYTRNTENFWDSGTTDTFAIPTSGYSKSDTTVTISSLLRVEVGGVLKTLTTDYTIPAPGTHVVLNAPVNCATSPVRIYRDSFGLTNPIVSFPAVTALNSKKHLNKSAWNLWWLIEELRDMFLKCLSVTVSATRGFLDAKDFPIGNLGQGTEADDAARISDVTTAVATAASYTDAEVAAEAVLRQAADTVLDNTITSTANSLVATMDSKDTTTLNSANAYALGLDTTRKNYVDSQDAATYVAANAYAAGLDAARKAYVDNMASILYANDTSTLLAAQAYTRNWLTTVNYLTAPVSDLVANSVTPLVPGQTRVFLPSKNTEVLVFIGGVLQIPGVDYTMVAKAYYLDLVTPVPAATNAYIVIFTSAADDTSLFTQESVTISSGSDEATFSAVFDYGLLFLNGVLQDQSAFSHTPGTDVITLDAAVSEDSTATLVIFTTPVFSQETKTLPAGDLSVSFTVPYNNSLVFVGGLCQSERVDYTHAHGSDLLVIPAVQTRDLGVTRVMF